MKSVGGLAIVMVALVVGCGNEPSDMLCEPGATQACLCVKGGSGVQSCRSDDSGWDSCYCVGDDTAVEPPTEDLLQQDDGCVPFCARKQCGSDGCEGSCGDCEEGSVCLSGQCKLISDPCVAACADKECGDGGVAGCNCGSCISPDMCLENQCVPPPCTASCEGKQCGTDRGCDCGTCTGCATQCLGYQCEPASQVSYGCYDNDIFWKDSCGSWESKKEDCQAAGCDPGSNVCKMCVQVCTGKECGVYQDCDCGPCPSGYSCSSGKCVCQPSCAGKQCGDDGCGGDCGTCPAGKSCQAGQCQVVCGDGACGGSEDKCSCPADCAGGCAGCCQGTVCSAGTLTTECGKNGATCTNCLGSGKVCQNQQCVSTTPECGDGSCNGSETQCSCPGDCGLCSGCCSGSACNSGASDTACGLNGASCTNCSNSGKECQNQQCATPAPTCGDGLCNGNETSCNCNQDCGACGGCCSGSICKTGTNDLWCGKNGVPCAFCALSGQVCLNYQCVTTTPTWTDPTSGLDWQNPPYDGKKEWVQAKAYCQSLSLGGGGWHLPTIGELRSLIRGCPGTIIGGECGVSDACVATRCLSAVCWSCTILEGPASGCYWPDEMQGPCDAYAYWSSSAVVDYADCAWYIAFSNGGVYNGNNLGDVHRVRCVR